MLSRLANTCEMNSVPREETEFQKNYCNYFKICLQVYTNFAANGIWSFPPLPRIWPKKKILMPTYADPVTPFWPRWRPFLWPFAREGPLSQNHWTCQANLGFEDVGGWWLVAPNCLEFDSQNTNCLGVFLGGVGFVFLKGIFWGMQLGNLGYWLELPTKPRIPVTTRIIPSLVGNPNLNLHLWLLSWVGGTPKELIHIISWDFQDSKDSSHQWVIVFFWILGARRKPQSERKEMICQIWIIFWENVTNLKIVWDSCCSHLLPHTPKYERKCLHFHISTIYEGLGTVALQAPPFKLCF